MDIKEKLANLPKKPGSYQMKDKDGTIIYVGKAKNLYNRVNSYFRGVHDAKTTKLVSQIADFEYILTNSEVESFILEINLIKKYRPKYNILLMDDKTYPYICLTDEKHPRIIYTRSLDKKYGKYFGPYPNPTSAKEACELLNKIYPLRKCRTIPKKPCLYYHLNQCLAPCINDIDSDIYKDITTKIVRFLKGNIDDEINNLESAMNIASEELNFEKAIECRELINNLKIISQKQKMEMDLSDSDIFNYYSSQDKISIQVFHIRSGKMIERTGNIFELNLPDFEIFIEYIFQFYYSTNNPIPKEIILPNLDYTVMPEDLQKRIVIPKLGRKLELLNLVYDNAQEKIELLSKSNDMKYQRTYGAILELGKLLNIQTPHVIEAFDNSNIQGASSVSAMVSYFDGIPNKKEYRKYKVKTVDGANDFETMKEVVLRRYSRLKNENKPLPNLIVIDGGKVQVEFAEKALQEIQTDIDIIGLVKDDKHCTDYIIYRNKEYKIDKRSGLFLLLESIQAEVHRYAISYHHLVHSKSTFESGLDKIKGIGPVKKAKILQLLGTRNFNENSLKQLNLNERQIQEILSLFK